jgi:hypothetical protein
MYIVDECERGVPSNRVHAETVKASALALEGDICVMQEYLENTLTSLQRRGTP